VYTANRQLGELQTEARIARETSTPAPDQDLINQVQAGNDAINNVIRARTQEEIMALPTEQRWAEYGKTYEEEQEYRRTHDQNPDGTAKYTTENIIGGVISAGLAVAAAAVTLGIAAPAIFGGSSAVVAEGAITAAAPQVGAAVAAPIAASSVAVAAPIVETVTAVAAAKGVSFLDTIISGASSVVDSVANSPLLDSPLVQKAVGSALSNAFAGSSSAQQAAAQIINPTQSNNAIAGAQAVSDTVNKKIDDLASKLGGQKTDNTLVYVGLGLAAAFFIFSKRR